VDGNGNEYEEQREREYEGMGMKNPFLHTYRLTSVTVGRTDFLIANAALYHVVLPKTSRLPKDSVTN